MTVKNSNWQEDKLTIFSMLQPKSWTWDWHKTTPAGDQRRTWTVGIQISSPLPRPLWPRYSILSRITTTTEHKIDDKSLFLLAHTLWFKCFVVIVLYSLLEDQTNETFTPVQRVFHSKANIEAMWQILLNIF